MQIDLMHPSHIPVLKAIIEVMKPESCVECGSGDHSTPLLNSSVKDYMAIEHSAEWRQRAIDRIGDEVADKIIYSPVPEGIKYSHYVKAVSDENRKTMSESYIRFVKECDFLFIDSWASTRYMALKRFWGKFKIAALHDSEEKRYGYKKVIEHMPHKGYVQIFCIPSDHKQPQTDVLIAPAPLSLEIANEIISKIKCEEFSFTFKVKRLK